MSFRVPFSLSTLFPAVPVYQRSCDWTDFREFFFFLGGGGGGGLIKIFPENPTLVTSDINIGHLTGML